MYVRVLFDTCVHPCSVLTARESRGHRCLESQNNCTQPAILVPLPFSKWLAWRRTKSGLEPECAQNYSCGSADSSMQSYAPSSPTKSGYAGQQRTLQPIQNDYVNFNRDTSHMSKSTSLCCLALPVPRLIQIVDKAAATKLKLEHFYKVAVEHAVERNQR